MKKKSMYTPWLPSYCIPGGQADRLCVLDQLIQTCTSVPEPLHIAQSRTRSRRMAGGFDSGTVLQHIDYSSPTIALFCLLIFISLTYLIKSEAATLTGYVSD